MLDALGLPESPGRSGRSLLELARQEEPARVVHTAWKDQQLALLPPWKLVVGADGGSRLYDVEADPDEQQDLFAEREALARELERTLREVQPGLSEAASQSDAVLDRLRALGYVD